MKTLYLDCSMGAAGDMLTAALIELIDKPQDFLDKLNKIFEEETSLKKVRFFMETVTKCGILGTHMNVLVDGTEECGHGVEHAHAHEHAHEHTRSHHHSSMHDIEHIIYHLNITPKVREDVLNVYRIIADAESKVHGVKVDEIHFHEVGNLDAIADITAVCMLMDEIKAEKIVASAVHVGAGQVRCAHGILPVPAPATALILKDVPCYGGKIKGELCTPTGAALLKYFVNVFGDMPVMNIQRIGYGMGKKDFEAANCLRAFLGEVRCPSTISDENTSLQGTLAGQEHDNSGLKDRIIKLECNLDDMTAEEIGFAMERLFDDGALDVFTTPVMMKKSRPGVLLTILISTENKTEIIESVFKYTSTIGIRETICDRYILKRENKSVNTEVGDVSYKSSEGYGVTRIKLEYDDISKIAKEKNVSIEEIKKIVKKYVY